MTALDTADRVLFLHAHPDDETLATGTLIADLVARGVEVGVVTATRGERGETRVTSADLIALRERELAAALGVLGVHRHGFLGQPPARSAGLPPRRYTDSGMVWLTETLAGAAPDSGPDALTAADPAEAAADLAGYAEWFGAQALVSYDAAGGYGHPDHVACHRIGRRAAALAGTAWFEIVSHPSADPGAVDLARYRDTVVAALGQYRSQLQVDGDEVVHVGGQRQPVPTLVAVREVPPGRRP